MAEGFDDLFGDISFEDAKIQVGGDPQGQKPDETPAGTGQEPGSQPGDQKVTDPNKTTDPSESLTDGDDKGKKVDDKSLPFDQNPKWIKARAAEKMLQEILEENQFLDIDELKESIASGKTLKEALADQDIESLKKDSAAYKEYQRRMEEGGDTDGDDDPNAEPDEKLNKVLRENQKLKDTLNEIRQNAQREEEDEEAFNNYTSDVDKILEVMADDVPLNEVETKLFKSVMGIENPSTEVDIENRAEVRAMVKNAAKQFHATLEAVKQQAIDDFAKGKSKMVVTDPKKSADLDNDIVNKKSYDPEKQSVDEVFDTGKNELLELIVNAQQ